MLIKLQLKTVYNVKMAVRFVMDQVTMLVPGASLMRITHLTIKSDMLILVLLIVLLGTMRF